MSSALLPPLLLVLPAVAYTWYVRTVGTLSGWEPASSRAVVMGYGACAALPVIVTLLAWAGARAAAWNGATTVSLGLLGAAALSRDPDAGRGLAALGSGVGLLALGLAVQTALASPSPTPEVARRRLTIILSAVLLVVVAQGVLWQLEQHGAASLAAVALCAAGAWYGLLLYEGWSQQFQTCYQLAVGGISFSTLAEVLRMGNAAISFQIADLLQVGGGWVMGYVFAAVCLALLPSVRFDVELEEGATEADEEG